MAQFEKIAHMLLNSKYVTALTGAGVSVESGIRPFRGPGGLWTEKGEPSMNGYQRFLENPKKYWDTRNKRGKNPSNVKSYTPNPGHYALNQLEKMGILKTLITQNIDDLHNVAGNNNVIEIHGNSKKMRCISCSTRWNKEKYMKNIDSYQCPNCGGIVKGDTVMFGEPIPTDVLEQTFLEAEKSDCMIVAGTSAVVQPAASLPLIVKRKGGSLIEVNPMLTSISDYCDLVIRQPSGEFFPQLIQYINRKNCYFIKKN